MTTTGLTTTRAAEGEREHGTRPRVLSIQDPTLGHQTYGRMIRRYLADSPLCAVEAYWADEERSLKTRLVNRLAHHPIRAAWVRRRNLDLYHFRIEAGMANLGRVMAQRLLRAGDYDCLHFHTQTLGFFSEKLARRLPVVFTTDQTVAQAVAASDAPAWTHAAHIALERRAFASVTRLVVMSEWAAHSAIGDQGVPPEKVRVIHPGVDLGVFPPRPDDARPGGPIRLLFIGGDFERKGGEDLLDVFLRDLAPQAGRGTPPVELHLVTGAALPTDLPPAVHVHRGVKAYSPEWLRLYQSADVFVLPTRREPYGLVFAEAMAAGLPVVATRLNAIPELVSHGETGLLVMPGDRQALADSLRALVADPALRRRYGQAGRGRAERCFDASDSFPRLGEVFAEAARSVCAGKATV